MLNESIKDLDNGLTPDLVSRKISNGITKYLFNHDFDAPNSILYIAAELETNADFFRGKNVSITKDLISFLNKFYKKVE